MLTVFIQILAVVGILATAIIYGTDACAALIMRPVYARLDAGTLTAVAGWGHFYGDRRMPIPGAGGVIAAVLTTVLAVAGGHFPAAIAGGVAVLALLAWLAIYVRVAKPVNLKLTAAAKAGDTPVNARALQDRWESVLGGRVALQALAVAALCVTIALL